LLLLEGLCDIFGVKVTRYLGAGASGRCFEVQSQSTGNTMALKAVLTCQKRSVDMEALVAGEFAKLVELSETPAVEYVVSVERSSLMRIYDIERSIQIGIGFLMLDVGTPIVNEGLDGKIPSVVISQLFTSLNGLHLLGHYHGDSRVQNAIFVEERVVWIDLIWGRTEPVGTNANRKKCDDMELLLASIFDYNSKIGDHADRIKVLLSKYATTLSNASEIVSYATEHLAQRKW